MSTAEIKAELKRIHPDVTGNNRRVDRVRKLIAGLQGPRCQNPACNRVLDTPARSRCNKIGRKFCSLLCSRVVRYAKLSLLGSLTMFLILVGCAPKPTKARVSPMLPPEPPVTMRSAAAASFAMPEQVTTPPQPVLTSLWWDHSGVDISGFVVERTLDLVNWEQIATVHVGTFDHEITNGWYTWRFRMTNEPGTFGFYRVGAVQ